MGAAEVIFESITGEGTLNQWVKDKRPEDLHLEFTTKDGPRPGKMDPGDKEKFSKVLSSFANADGGVLVYGVLTKDPEGIDRARALAPIAQVEHFYACLLDSVNDTTDPRIEGVLIEMIPSANGAGYIKCLVPASDRPPHRALWADDIYYRRTMVGALGMQHYELEDLFGRRLRPVLRIQIALLPRAGDDPHEDLDFSFLNVGRGVGKHAGFLCGLPADATITDTMGRIRNVTHLNKGMPTLQYYDPEGVVHANGIFAVLYQATIRRPNKGAPLNFNIKWYAEDMVTRKAEVEIEPGQARLVSGDIALLS